MKRTKTIFLIVCLSFFGMKGHAQAPVSIYEASSLPTEQGWTERKLDNSVNTLAAPTTLAVENGALRLTSTNDANQFSQLGWYKTGLGLLLGKGYTIEIKAKLNVAAKGSFNIQGYDNEGKGFRVNITATGLTNQSNPLDATTTVESGWVNDSEFHTYRLAVAASGVVTVYRDAASIGTFPLSAFQFDNIIENGGFEDEAFPDFLSNGIIERSSMRPFAGQSALLINSDGKNNGTFPKEGMTTRAFPLKPETDYEFSLTRRRAVLDNEWAWRDFGAYWNTQDGSVNDPEGEATAEPRERWWNNCFETRAWTTGTETFNKGTDAEKNAIRFEFPSWIRESTKNTSKVAIDNVVLREKTALKIGPTIEPAHANPSPVFHEGYVNLIANGDFENHTINNDGTEYAWALASAGGDNDNTPTAYNEMWNGNVRIQDKNKPNDFEETGDEYYAHSGNSALRFSTLNEDNQGKTRNFDFTVELEANKTYRFSFWHRNPKWNDFGWLLVRVGDGNPIWGHRTGSRANKWIPVDLVFTTTETNKTLHLYTISDAHGDWWNQYLDDLVLYEIPAATPLDPQIAGKTNLIANGDFEDVTLNNDGTPYTWALASDSASNDNDFPMAYNEMWGSWVRLQDKEKRGTDFWGDRDDTGYDWAHSGTRSLRFTFEDNFDGARNFQGYTGDQYPDAYRLNLNFKKELEPNKTYTFVFWIKTSCWNDRGWVKIANGDIVVWSQEVTNKYMNWSRQSVTFSTTGANHTLRLFTEFGGWFNFYLDDLFLYEEETYVPYTPNGDSYLFFGKSQTTAGADVEVEYVKLIDAGAYTPEGNDITISAYITYHLNGGTNAVNGIYSTATELTLPTPEKTGYTFLGWYDNAELTGDAVTAIPQGSYGNKEFWAKWEAVTYTIKYNVDGGTAIADGSYTIESEAITLPTPEKTGYTFLGWFDNAELTGDAVTAIPQGSTGNKEFWAKWDIIDALSTIGAALRLYPNPVVNGKLTIDNANSATIEVYHILGTLAGVYNATGSKTVIDISSLPAGTYLVKTGGSIAKIVKK